MARFEQVEETFWSDSAVGVQPPLTDEVIVGAERLLGVRLPLALLELLRIQDGGVVADAWNSFVGDAGDLGNRSVTVEICDQLFGFR